MPFAPKGFAESRPHTVGDDQVTHPHGVGGAAGGERHRADPVAVHGDVDRLGALHHSDALADRVRADRVVELGPCDRTAVRGEAARRPADLLTRAPPVEE